jgi:hypothetical protein
MSGHGFHVHGPHDHELEHAAHAGGLDSFSGKVAVTTALLATVGALFGYMAGATQANAGLLKNDAAIKKTEASNQWNYYQAKGNKRNLADLAAVLAPADKQEFYNKEVARYKKDQEEIKLAAEKFEAESKDFDDKSAEQMHLHHRWAQATTALQIAIAMSAIAILTRRKWLLYGVYGVGVLGVALGGLALAHI